MGKGWGCVVTRLENAAYPANVSVTNDLLNVPNSSTIGSGLSDFEKSLCLIVGQDSMEKEELLEGRKRTSKNSRLSFDRCLNKFMSEFENVTAPAENVKVKNEEEQDQITSKGTKKGKLPKEEIPQLKVEDTFLITPNPRDYPEYYEDISHPMDFETIRHRVTMHHYETFNHFQRDFSLLYRNAKKFNGVETQIYRDAEAIFNFLEKKKPDIISSMDKTIKKKISSDASNDIQSAPTGNQSKSKVPSSKRRRGRSAGPVSPFKDPFSSKRKFGFSEISSLMDQNYSKPWLLETKRCDLCECFGNESNRDAAIMKEKLGLLEGETNNQGESNPKMITPSSASVQTYGSTTVESPCITKEYVIKHVCSACLNEAGSHLVGMRIVVFRSSDDCYYIGQVTAYDEKSNEHCIWYQDGEWEYVKLSAEQFFFLEPFKLIVPCQEET